MRGELYYHLNGAGMGTLELEETTDGTSWSTIWTKSGDQGDSWQSATVSVTTSYVSQLRWVGTTGSDAYSDMAIDDVDIRSAPTSNGDCFVPTPAPTTSAPTSTPLPIASPTAFPTSIAGRDFDGTTALAFQWPHQAKHKNGMYEAWHEEKQEAKRFVKKSTSSKS